MVEEHPPLIGDAITNNGPGLLLVVERFPNTDPAEVIRGVDAALSQMQQGLPGVDIDGNIFRSTSFVEASINNLGKALLLGGALLIIAVAGSLLSWRATLTCLVAIATSFLAAMLVLRLRGAPINSMVLAGLAVALTSIIDDAIIAVENVDRRLRQRSAEGNESAAAIVLDACLKIRAPIAYATLIALLAVAPLFLVTGPLGAFLAPLAFSYALAIIASMIVALAVVPALALLLLRVAPSDGRKARVLLTLEQRYEAALARVVTAPRSGILVASVGAIAIVAAMPLLSWSLLPSFKEADVQIIWEAAPGTSHPEMLRTMTRVSEELRAIPGVGSVAAHAGRAVTGDQVVGIESGQIWIGMDPKSDYAATITAIRETVAGIPGIDAAVQTYLSNKVGQELSGPGAPIQVRIEGPDRKLLQDEAGKVAKTPRRDHGRHQHSRRRSGRCAPCRNRSELGGGRSGWADAGRRAPRGSNGFRRPRRGQFVRATEGVRSGGLGGSGIARQSHRCSRVADRYAQRKSGSVGRSCRRAHRSHATDHRSRRRVAICRCQRQRHGSRRGLGCERDQRPAREGRIAVRVPCRPSQRLRRTAGG